MMRYLVCLLSALLATTPVMVSAQITPPATEAPDSDRIEAARGLLDLIMPPDQRAAMMTAMVEPMIANLQAGLMQSPQLQSTISNNSEAQALLMQFLAGQRSRALDLATSNMPGLMEASARAYARQFTVRELRDIQEFFETRAGQTYLREASTIMADPDIAAWQRGVMAQSMQTIQSDITEFAASLAGLEGGNSAAPDRPVTNSNLDAMRGGTETPEPETEE